MPRIDAVVECPVHDSFRVQQVAGMFDVPLAERSRESFSVEAPALEESWDIGMIVGPSGSGKSTIAREYFGERLYRGGNWPTDRAVIDCFDDLPLRETTSLLTAVGFSSPPSWVKPYSVLSGGEQLRCDLARALGTGGQRPEDGSSLTDWRRSLSDTRPAVVFDEFTSVVDRNVAKICSAAVSKAVRRGSLRRRFVAVTCHRDVAEWLEPDWVADMATGKLERRRLRRPGIEMRIFRCKLDAWDLFKRHHYLTGSLARSSRCYLALWRKAENRGLGNGDWGLRGAGENVQTAIQDLQPTDIPVAFCATLPVIGRRRHRRFTRIVTLPDYQGVGIGMRMVEAVAELHKDEGHRINVTSSHPSLIRHASRSPLWRTRSVNRQGSSHAGRFLKGYRSSMGRAVVSFEYAGKRLEVEKQMSRRIAAGSR